MRLMTVLMAGMLTCAGALAQTPPAKPAAKPAAKAPVAKPATDDGKTVSMGAGTGPILTREQLRACFDQEKTVKGRLTEVEARRVALDKEQATLKAEQDTLLADRTALENPSDIQAVRTRMTDYAARVDQFNERSAALAKSDRAGPQVERMRMALDREREELGKQQAQLEADKTRVNEALAQANTAYNARVAAQEGRVSDWNQRNKQLNQDALLLEDDRLAWVNACKDKRYRESDETAIRNGK